MTSGAYTFSTRNVCTTCPMCRFDVGPDSLTFSGGDAGRPWDLPKKGVSKAWARDEKKRLRAQKLHRWLDKVLSRSRVYKLTLFLGIAHLAQVKTQSTAFTRATRVMTTVWLGGHFCKGDFRSKGSRVLFFSTR